MSWRARPRICRRALARRAPAREWPLDPTMPSRTRRKPPHELTPPAAARPAPPPPAPHRRRRNKPTGARGRVRRVRCESSAALVPKDKAVPRLVVRDIVDASALRGIAEACPLEGCALPKIHCKVYSISSAIHSRVVGGDCLLMALHRAASPTRSTARQRKASNHSPPASPEPRAGARPLAQGAARRRRAGRRAAAAAAAAAGAERRRGGG
jgi:small subunit ribosomal protein S26e